MANRSSTPRDKPTAVKIALELKARINDVGASQMVESIVLRLFLSLFPLMIILVAVIGFIATKRSGGTDAVVGDIVDKLHLGGSSADLVEGMVKSAEKSRGAASGIGLVTVLLSAVSVMGAIAAACDRAWQVAKRGLLDKAMGVVWLIGTIVLFGLSGWVVKLAGMLPIPGLPTVLGLISGTVLGTALFV